jgi:glycosyltransferase involved in cell wall biosynthesis
VLLRETPVPLTYRYEIDDPSTLPFELALVPQDHHICAIDLEGVDIVLASGDSHDQLHLADLCRDLGIRLLYSIEYIPETRSQIIYLDRTRSLPRKLRTMLWNYRQERRRRRAFEKADALQANGYPAAEFYRRVNPNTLLYLDNRIGEAMLATPAEMAARASRLRSGAPLRLLNSGRLEPMKGAQDLVPIARKLAADGVDFELDIFGAGSLAGEIRDGIAAHGLEARVRLHAPVDFDTELVPFARREADLFLSCNRQSDPSCTYLESMGCGLPVAGYDNRMWKSLLEASAAGWSASLGNAQGLASCLSRLAGRREEILTASERALEFTRKHVFESEFALRAEHMKAVLEAKPSSACGDRQP